MTSTFNESGIVYDKYADIKTDMETSIKDSIGESANLDGDGYLGHINEIIALTESKANEIGQQVYDSGFVGSSSGAVLDGNVGHVGLEREGFSFSTIEQIQLTASKAVTVPAGTRYGTETNVIFETDADLIFTAAGTDTVSGTCTVEGDKDVGIGELNTIKETVNGITAVTNLTAAVPGADRQTDPTLKEVHGLVTATSGEDDTASQYEALYEIPVSSAKIIDNDTSEYLGVVPPHTTRTIVIGGTDEEVATAIWRNKTSSVRTYGAESYECYDPTYGQSKIIYFDRGAENSIFVAINITKYGTYPNNGDALIKEAFAAIFAGYKLGSTVDYNQLVGAVYSVAGVKLNTLYIGESASPSGTSDIVQADTELPSLDVVRNSADEITSINVEITES